MSKPRKTVFILAAGVPGDHSAEPMAICDRGIVQPDEITLKRTGVPAQRGETLPTHARDETFRKGLKGPQRFSVVEHVLYRQIVP